MSSSNEEKSKLIEEDFEMDTEEEEAEGWDDWNEDEDGEEAEDVTVKFKCLFCDDRYNSSHSFFEHCVSKHLFDFRSVRETLGLDFYGCFKLINYVRQMVAENQCWSWSSYIESNQELLNQVAAKDLKFPWDDDKYLRPFIQGDPLLYTFDEEEEDDDDEVKDSVTTFNKEELAIDCKDVECLSIDTNNTLGSTTEYGTREFVATSNGQSKNVIVNCVDVGDHDGMDTNHTNKMKSISFTNVAASEIKKVNESYFGSYSSFGIHREMLSDKARTDAYGKAISDNPSLLKNAVVMDLGCGTGILSLFAAQAGASSVIAIEASDKMAAVATQIAKDNGYGHSVIKVANGMVEELDLQLQPQSIDVLLSEWMGYCLLYESMLSSVLYARDKWLKPGGAILPDTATMFAAGFGKGGTSLPFWENVYGFNMSSVGKELVQDAAKFPIVDVVDSLDLVTTTAVLQSFDIVTMTVEDMDFTSSIELEPKDIPSDKPTWCHGIVLWFDTGFTSRFCKETPTVLSTSPYTPKTHWSQTILTFKEPIAMSQEKTDRSTTVQTVSCPAAKIHLRISIARAVQHRAIDISLETTAIMHDGRKNSRPVQIFNLC